ncbi:hypothetical protein ASPZODRAFT_101369 [Penicilliopsis zonata CBS 506.65]|uniref:Major facilitator superfamily (MFS) profile domain-containing protein n=1 Tax=Penicilliopsis zonata CBS 506.65 TaxID=1073090 RepID=A0A1L9SB02_9EURO|nr:hypothetical protein ASPZODRAFT_101369 [Penicilliopsis zonata CBS 506.65]OJJ44353.1 hypothetical protein ASPZODRAFT_101369 [Penicilliopsis zonata CBS 506.65]
MTMEGKQVKDTTNSRTDTSLDGPDGVPDSRPDQVYPSGLSLVSIIIALDLAVFLVALDRTIIATATPRITDHFNSLDDVAWYGSSYLLTYCTFQLLFGRVYTFYPPKWVFLAAIAIFEVGSAVCGAAPSSTIFIVGRAVAGLGAAGIFSGAVVIIVDSVPLHKRPMYTGFLGAMFGISSVVAPLLGGAFTDRVSWRWCFYVNLPIGAVAVAVIMLILRTTQPPNPSPAKTLRERIWLLDPLGNLCFFPGIVCLLLALEWGGSKYAWNNGRIISLFVLFGVLTLAFIALQIQRQEQATVPPRIVMQRSIPPAMLYSLCVGASMMLMVYYLPIWFQAIKGVSAMKSGLMNLPLVLSLVLGSILAGILVSKLGYYTPFLLLGTILSAVGIGLITTFTPTTNLPKWLGYQVLYGLGLGVGMQQPNVAAQTVLPRQDVPTGIALLMFMQSLGGSLFLSVGENVFTNRLIGDLSSLSLQGVDVVQVVLGSGATDLRDKVAAQDLPPVLAAYNDSIRSVFIVALAVVCASIVGGLFVEWKSVKNPGATQVADGQETSM